MGDLTVSRARRQPQGRGQIDITLDLDENLKGDFKVKGNFKGTGDLKITLELEIYGSNVILTSRAWATLQS